MTSNLLDTTVEDILHDVFDSSDAPVYVVGPSEQLIDRLITAAMNYGDDRSSIRLLAEEDTLKELFEDFIVASTAADLVNANDLQLRISTEDPENAVMVTDERVVAIVRAGETLAGLVTEDETFVTTALSAYESVWTDAANYDLRTPPLSQVRESLNDDLDPSVEEDFAAVLSSMETARGDATSLDEVTVSLLVAARNEQLLYDISKWGEDVGIASKATFSRTKSQMEDVGLIDTEKVPIDVGRPRLRLKLGRDELREAEPDQLTGLATSILN